MKKHILFLFVDGIGLGDDDPQNNPFVKAKMSILTELSNGQTWTHHTPRQQSAHAAFVPTDPRLGVDGRPQSGSSQAAILTGQNVPQMLGRHYGPLPNQPIRDLLDETNFFITLKQQDRRGALVSAYPPQRMAGINSGKRLPSSIQYAAIASGQPLFTKDDVMAERALTAEYTGIPWRDHLNIDDIPIYEPYEAGRQLVEISRQYDFALHSHWMTDYIGHRGSMEQAVSLLEVFDEVIRGIITAWDMAEGLVIITSDHGNMEDIESRKHTENDVPSLIIGDDSAAFADRLHQLTDFVPLMSDYLFDT